MRPVSSTITKSKLDECPAVRSELERPSSAPVAETTRPGYGAAHGIATRRDSDASAIASICPRSSDGFFFRSRRRRQPRHPELDAAAPPGGRAPAPRTQRSSPFLRAIAEGGFVSAPAGPQKLYSEVRERHRLAGQGMSDRHAEHVPRPCHQRADRVVRHREHQDLGAA